MTILILFLLNQNSPPVPPMAFLVAHPLSQFFEKGGEGGEEGKGGEGGGGRIWCK